MIVVKPGFF